MLSLLPSISSYCRTCLFIATSRLATLRLLASLLLPTLRLPPRLPKHRVYFAEGPHAVSLPQGLTSAHSGQVDADRRDSHKVSRRKERGDILQNSRRRQVGEYAAAVPSARATLGCGGGESFTGKVRVLRLWWWSLLARKALVFVVRVVGNWNRPL